LRQLANVVAQQPSDVLGKFVSSLTGSFGVTTARMHQIATWPKSLALEQYVDCVAENDARRRKGRGRRLHPNLFSKS
jgi:hypothetical protein